MVTLSRTSCIFKSRRSFSPEIFFFFVYYLGGGLVGGSNPETLSKTLPCKNGSDDLLDHSRQILARVREEWFFIAVLDKKWWKWWITDETKF